MAPLPKGFSLRALPIEEAIREGRTEDAKRLICEILRAGNADSVVQGLAANMITPPKRGRGRPATEPQHWFDIGTEFHHLRSSGWKYEDVMVELERRFGYADATLRKAIAYYESAKAAHDAITARNSD